MIQTTVRHFAVFKKEAEKWIDRLGLLDWRIEFEHMDDPGGKPARAWFRSQVEGRFAELGLSKNWSGDPVTGHKLRETAFHEVCELLLCPIGWIAECRYAREEEIPEAIHTVIRRLENYFYGRGKGKVG
jgi:hypothetical protein